MSYSSCGHCGASYLGNSCPCGAGPNKAFGPSVSKKILGYVLLMLIALFLIPQWIGNKGEKS